MSQDEEAVLRAWLCGHKLADIAKAHRRTEAAVFRVLTEVCGNSRVVGQQVLDDGVRRPAVARPAAPPRPADVVVLDRHRPEPVPPADDPAASRVVAFWRACVPRKSDQTARYHRTAPPLTRIV